MVSAPVAVEPVALPVEIIAISSIDYVVDNHRTSMDPVKLEELAASIRANGVKQPIGVCRRGDRNVIIWGHRRVKASTMAGLATIPAAVATGLTDAQIAEQQVMENIHREDLSPIDEAYCVKTLMDGGHSLENAASMMGKGVVWARQRLDLLRLDATVLDLVQRGRLPLGHAVLISRVGDSEKQVDLAESAVGIYHHSGKQGREEALADDYVEPLKSIRKSISWYMCKMGSAFWPKDIPYAGMRPCAACPDCTSTEPGLFEGIDLTSAKGNCTNKKCFEKKSKAWEKDPEKLRRDKEREAQKAAADKGGSSASPKPAAGSSESYELKRKRIAALVKAFPQTAGQKLAVAQWTRLQAIADAIGAFIKALPKANQRHVEVVLLAALDSGTNLDDLKRESKAEPPLSSGLAQAVASFSPAMLAAIWNYSKRLNEWMGPRVEDYDGEVHNVPLKKEWLGEIAEMEQTAAAWGVSIPPAPKAEDFQDNAPPPVKKAKKAK